MGNQVLRALDGWEVTGGFAVDSFYLICLWLMSLFAATYLGYDRGRWEAGLLLGLFFGPLGVIAAGLMNPSIELAAQREHLLQLHLARLERAHRKEIAERRRARDDLGALADAVDTELRVGDGHFADQLDELATDLHALTRSEGVPPDKLRLWTEWLSDKAEFVRGSPRHRREDV